MSSTLLALSVAIVVGGYLLGSVPFGLLVAKRQGGIDLRSYGSGSTGATNVYRAVGWKASTVVIAADVLKAIIPILVARYAIGSFAGQSEAGLVPVVESAAGLAAIAGHCWPIYTGGTGGKGAASSLGAMMVINTPIGTGCLLIAALTVARTRFVSLGSISAAVFGLVGMVYLLVTGQIQPGYVLFTAVCPVIVFIRHWDNIGRLLAGRERKLGDAVNNSPKRMTS